MDKKIFAYILATMLATASLAFALPSKYHPAEEVVNGTLGDNYTVNGTLLFKNNVTFSGLSIFDITKNLVGIGNTNPNSTLHVVGTGTTGGLRVTNQSNGYETFFVNSTLGRVGIGTANPSQNLDVNGTFGIKNQGYIDVDNTNFIFYRADGADRKGIITRDLQLTANGAVFTTSDIDDYKIDFQARDNGVGLVTIATMQSATDPYFKAGNLYALYSGNVGIGTTNPLSKLHASGNATFNATGQNIVEFYNGTTDNANNKVQYINSTGATCFGSTCSGQIFYNGTAMVIRVV